MKGKDVSSSFFDEVMRELGVTPTPEKQRFFKAWQRAEGTSALYNPLATTWKTSSSKKFGKNTAGVQNYDTQSEGVRATAKTLKLSYYNELTDKLRRNDITAEELAASTKALKTWSSGDGKYVARVLGSSAASLPTSTTTRTTNVSNSKFSGVSTTGVNSSLLQDLSKAASDLGMNLYFSSTTGGKHTTNSRHYSGNAVDIAAINGFSWRSGRSKFIELGNQLDAKLQSMGYTNDSEGKNLKSVLWRMNKYGNYNKDHEDHLHVSNLTNSISTTGGKIVVDPTNNIQNTIDTEEQTADSTVTNFREVVQYLRKNFSPVRQLDVDTHIFRYNDEFITIHSNGTADIENQQDKTKTTESWILNKSGETYKLTIGSQVLDPTKNTADIDTEADDEDWNVIDYIQLILDFAGFIPGYGDIIDIVNAIVYFIRGKYIDGFLSLIAVIPVAGSVIKFGFKGAFKAIKASRIERALVKAYRGSPREWHKLLLKLAKEGKISKLQLKQMANAGDDMAKLLRMKGKDLAKYERTLKAMGTTPAAVMAQMDKYASVVQRLMKIESGVSRTSKFWKWTGKKLNWIANVVSLGTWTVIKEVLKALNLFDIGKLKQLENGIKAIYKEKLFASNILAAQMAHANKFMPSHFLKTKPTWLRKNVSNIEIKNALDALKRSDTKMYKKTIEEIASKTANSRNIWYRTMANNELQIAGTAVFQPGKVFKGNVDGRLGNIFKQMNGLMNVKALDVYSNEIQDLAEKMGIDPEDDPNGVIVPAIVGGTLWIMGDKDQKEGEQNDISNVLSAGTKSEMKRIYDSTEGEPAERLEKMAEAGWDEVSLIAFSKLFKLF
jgi:hypothetical protein